MAGITSPYGGTYTAIDALLTTTLQHYDEKGKIQDAVFLANPTFRKLFQGGRVKTVNGGAQIVVNLMYGSNTTVGSRGKYEEVDISPQDGMTQSFADWALYQQAISIDDHEIDQNMGEGKLKDLMDAKYEQMTMTWGEKLSADLFDVVNITTTTGKSGNGGKNIQSIPLIVWKAPQTSNVCQGITSSTSGGYTWWQNQYKDGDGATTDDLWKSTMANMYNTCFKQGAIGGEPDLIVMNQIGYELYESTLEPYKQYTNSNSASAGFKNLTYKNAEIVWDPYMCDMEAGTNYTSSDANCTMFFLNTKFLAVNVMKGKNFKSTPFVRPTNQAARTALNLWTGQLVCSNRRKQGVIFDLPLAAGLTVAT